MILCGKHKTESEKILIYVVKKFKDRNDTLLVSSRTDRAHVPHIIICICHNNMACIPNVIYITYMYNYTSLCI